MADSQTMTFRSETMSYEKDYEAGWQKQVEWARGRFVSIRDALRKADSLKLVMDIMLINNVDLQQIELVSKEGRKRLNDLAAARQKELGARDARVPEEEQFTDHRI